MTDKCMYEVHNMKMNFFINKIRKQKKSLAVTFVFFFNKINISKLICEVKKKQNINCISLNKLRKHFIKELLCFKAYLVD